MDSYFGIYHEIFRIRENRKLFFTPRPPGTARSVDKILSGRRECRAWPRPLHQIRPRPRLHPTSRSASAHGARCQWRSASWVENSSSTTPARSASSNIRPGSARNHPAPLTDRL